MGWEKFLGDLAKDYISERGIGGALEDAGSIKDGFSYPKSAQKSWRSRSTRACQMMRRNISTH